MPSRVSPAGEASQPLCQSLGSRTAWGCVETGDEPPASQCCWMEGLTLLSLPTSAQLRSRGVGGGLDGLEWLPGALLILVGSLPLLTCSCCCLATQMLSARSQETDCSWAQSASPAWSCRQGEGRGGIREPLPVPWWCRTAAGGAGSGDGDKGREDAEDVAAWGGAAESLLCAWRRDRGRNECPKLSVNEIGFQSMAESGK